MMGRKHVLLVSVAVAAVPATAWPQTPGPVATASSAGGATSQNGRLEEIVVTAEKRASKVQSTPIAITAVSAAQLQARHVEDLTDLGAVLPNVQMVQVSQTVQVNIRGLGSNFFDPRGQTSVSQSIDGLAYTRPTQTGNEFFDISRIEVLNGPQGTLYGTNAAAGAVNVITNQPTNHLTGFLEGSFGNYLMREYAGMINVPLTDTLDVRVAAKGIYHNGYVENTYEDAANNSVRASAKWTPTTEFHAYFAYNYSEFDGNGTVAVSYPCDPVPYSNVISQRCAPPGASGGNFPLDGRTQTDLSTYQLNLDYDLGFADVTSITGLQSQSIKSEHVPNGTFFNVNLLQTSYDLSEEFRVAGKNSGNHAGEFGWVVGTYYSRGNGTNFFTGLGLPTDQPKLPENVVAGFGQGTFGVTNAIRFTAGIRYTHDEKGVDDVYGSNVTAAFNHINYRVGLEANPAKDSLVYATVSTGYVAGGADGGSILLPGGPGIVPPVFKPENVLSYEIGSKNTFLDGRLRINGDFFYYIIKNYQSYNPALLNNGEFGLQIQDIANSTIYGGELSGAFALTDADRFNFSGSLSHGEFGAIRLDSFNFSPFGLAPHLISVPAGFPQVNLPSWELRLGYAHTWNLANDATLEAGVDTHISGSYWVVPASTDPYDRQGSYTMTDLHLRYLMDNRLSVEAWVKNVENAAVTTYDENPGFHLFYPLPPRTFGVTVGYSFF